MKIRRWRLSDAAGFSMIEALVAIFIALIVLASMFSLLAGGARSSTVEGDRADLQAQTRNALNQMSRDVMLAGYGLPPEFPAFGTGTLALSTNSRSGPAPIEIVGVTAENIQVEPIAVESFDGHTARLGTVPTGLTLGQPVVVYDNRPIEGRWLVGLVSGLSAAPVSEVELVTGAGMSVATPAGTVSLPDDLERYNRSSDALPEAGYLMPIDVVRYELEESDDEYASVLVRQVNWGERVPVAHIESMEIRYFVGATLAGPIIQTAPRDGFGIQRVEAPAAAGTAATELELLEPPVPQPNPQLALDENSVVRAVRISLTGRSLHANLAGSTLKPGAADDEEGYVRQTLSTRVTTRNLLNRAENRKIESAAADTRRSQP
jgi:hypothetical protein